MPTYIDGKTGQLDGDDLIEAIEASIPDVIQESGDYIAVPILETAPAAPAAGVRIYAFDDSGTTKLAMVDKDEVTTVFGEESA
jgi:hypothetical protein